MHVGLFTKLFLSFWVVTLVAMAGWKLSFESFENSNLISNEVASGGSYLPSREIAGILFRLERGSIKSMERFLEGVRRRGVDLRLLALDGSSMDKASIPIELSLLVQTKKQLVDGVIVETGPGERFAVYSLIRRDLGPFVAAIRIGNSAERMRANPSSRFFIAILISGVLCFFLTWLFTRRLSSLRTASSQLAQGHLDTKIEPAAYFYDELDAVGEDLNAMAKRLKGRIDSQRRFLADVSHELRSPLARIQIALALAENSAAERRDNLIRIRLEAERLDEMIGQLIASQRDIGRLQEKTNLTQIAEALLFDAEIEAEDKAICLSLEAVGEPCYVMSDRTLLNGALENVFRNAITHSPREGLIKVKIQTISKDTANISIFDQGPGVPEADLDRIFDPFFRVEHARDRDTGGTGLGLAIAKRTVDQHGGEIIAKNIEGGFCVQIELPLFSS